MRKIIMMMLMLTLVVVTQAQQTSVGKARVSAIRQAYAEAKKKVANSDELAKQGKPSNRLVANSSYTLGKEAGMVTTTYYFTEEEDTLLGRFFYEPYFIVNNYNTPGNQYYQEFLYDQEDNLIFYYEKNNGNETRFYFGKDGENDDEGLVYEINTSYRVMEPPFAFRVGRELKNAFHLLMNRANTEYYRKRLTELKTPLLFSHRNGYEPVPYKPYKYVRFHRGYTSNTMTWEIEGIVFGHGKKEWGAPDEPCHIIKLGNLLDYPIAA